MLQNLLLVVYQYTQQGAMSEGPDPLAAGWGLDRINRHPVAMRDVVPIEVLR